MPLSVSVGLTGDKAFARTLNNMKPGPWLGAGLREAADKQHELAVEKYIIKGGRFRGKAGPRGGKGKLRDSKPNAKRITSRTGFLRDRIAVSTGIQFRFIEITSHAAYSATHEYGSPKQNIRARPFMAPVLEEASKSFAAIFVKHWNRRIVK